MQYNSTLNNNFKMKLNRIGILAVLALAGTVGLSSCKKDETGTTKYKLTQLEATKYAMEKEDGSKWDADGSGPDIFMRYNPASVDDWRKTDVKDDATGAPVLMSIKDDVYLSSDNWKFEICDNDLLSFDVMYHVEGNPIEGISSPRTFSSDNYTLKVFYEKK